MLKELFAVFDNKAGHFLDPFVSENNLTAERTFHRIISSVPPMADNCSDYELYCVGQFDINEGALVPIAIKRFVVNGRQVLSLEDRPTKHENSQVRNDASIQPSTESGDTA